MLKAQYMCEQLSRVQHIIILSASTKIYLLGMKVVVMLKSLPRDLYLYFWDLVPCSDYSWLEKLRLCSGESMNFGIGRCFYISISLVTFGCVIFEL